MLNTLAPRKLMNVDIGEYSYPLARRDRVPTATPFGALKDDLISTLSVPADDDPVSLFRHYAHNMKQLETLVQDTNRFLQVAATANGFKEFVAMGKIIRPPSPGIELGTQQPTIIRDTFNSLLAGQVNQYVRNLAHALDQAVERKLIGLISWQGDEAARYSWYNLQVIERQTDERKRTMVSQEKIQGGTNHRSEHVTERDKERVYRLSLRIHDLLNAKKHPLPANGVLKPAKVKNVLDAAPMKLHKHFFIVDGTQIRDITAQMDVKTERWTDTDIQVVNRFEPEEVTVVRYDPCLCLGHYCIIGWGEEELVEVRQQKEAETRKQNEAQAKAEQERHEAMARAERERLRKEALRLSEQEWQDAKQRFQKLIGLLYNLLVRMRNGEVFTPPHPVDTIRAHVAQMIQSLETADRYFSKHNAFRESSSLNTLNKCEEELAQWKPRPF